MEHQPATRRLTPAVYDLYVARARAERAEAIAGFGGLVAAWLRSLAVRLARRNRAAAARPAAGSPATR